MDMIFPCPLCGIKPRFEFDNGRLRLKCPDFGETMRQAVDDWNAGITPEYIREVSE